MKKKWIIILSSVVVIILIILVIMKNQGMLGDKKATKVTTEKVSTRTIIETVTANGKIQPEKDIKVSPFISGEIIDEADMSNRYSNITDASGRTLSGQTTEAFWNSLNHANPVSIGLNCALGPKELRQYVETLSNIANTHVSAHPNAGLPNEFGDTMKLRNRWQMK